MKLFPTLFVTVLFTGLASMPVLRAAEFTVINTNNAGAGSLRQAMLDANATPGHDRIVFNIPGDGIMSIRPETALPILTDPVEIDGYTQPGSVPNSLAQADNAVRRIAFDGRTSGGTGLHLRTHESVVRGVSMAGFGTAIFLQGSSNLVVGNLLGTESAPNIYTNSNPSSGNVDGIGIAGPCCGVSEVCCNTIGGAAPSDRNVIVGNNGNAIRSDEGSGEYSKTRVLGNFLGVDSTGLRASLRGGRSTLSLGAAVEFQIGGLGAGEGNVIACSSYAVNMAGQSRGFSILGNKIGVGSDGVTQLDGRGQGLRFFGAHTNQPGQPFPQSRVEGNVIANLVSAVGVAEFGFPDPQLPGVGVTRVTISQNSIYGNDNTGISLGPLARENDFQDSDTGANNRQNYPEIINAVFAAETTITGALYSRPSSNYRIEFFANTLPHPSGWGDGELFLFAGDVETDANGVAEFTFAIPELPVRKPFITATATDADGNTSMFSRPFHGRSLDVPLIHRHPQSAEVPLNFNATFTADVTGAAPLAYQWRFNGVDIPGATNLSLTVPGVSWESRGSYVLVVTNEFGIAVSDPATLSLRVRPVITQHPISQSIPTGGVAYLSVEVADTSTTPLTYIWRSNNIAVHTVTSMDYINVFRTPALITNVGYNVQVTNSFNTAGASSLRATVSILPDTDGDGLPDGYEDAFGLDRNNPADAGADLDNDGMSNGEEFTAGTDPNDPANTLRLLRVIAEAGGAAAVEFHARSNRTYRIESRDSLGGGAWQPAATIIARETNRVERWIDPSPAPSTYYRLRTPAASGQ